MQLNGVLSSLLAGHAPSPGAFPLLERWLVSSLLGARLVAGESVATSRTVVVPMLAGSRGGWSSPGFVAPARGAREEADG